MLGQTRSGGYMIRTLLMSIALSVLSMGAADAAVIYNWRTLGGPEDVVLEGRIGFSDEAWRARRAEVDFTGFGQRSPSGDLTVSYPGEDENGEVDLDPD